MDTPEKKICVNKECKNYSKEADTKSPPRYCSLRCKYDDPDFNTHFPYAD